MGYPHCRVKNCHNSLKHPGTAYKFCIIPSVPERRRQWGEAMGVDLTICNTHSSVCSDHFVAEDLVWNGKSWRLNKHAVPQYYLEGRRRCVVLGCHNIEKMEEGLHKFYMFPSFKISAQWNAFTKRKNFKPSPSSFICSDHFSIHQYNGEHLKWDAVPDVEGIKEEDEENVEGDENVKGDENIEIVEDINEEEIVEGDEENAEGDENIDQCEKAPENEESVTPNQIVNNKLWVVDQIVEIKPNGAPSNDRPDSKKIFLRKSRIPPESKEMQYRIKIKVLHQKVRRQEKRIAARDNLINILKNRLKHCKCDINDIL